MNPLKRLTDSRTCRRLLAAGLTIATLSAAGCAASSGGGLLGLGSLSDSSLEKEVANDSFPTASQAGITSQTPSE